MALLLDALTLPSETLAPFAPLLDAVLGEGGTLDRALREAIVRAGAAASGAAIELEPAAPAAKAGPALLSFGRRLAGAPVSVGAADVEALRQAGHGDEEILEATLAAGCGRALAILAAARRPRAAPEEPEPPPPADARPGPWVRSVERSPADLPAFAALKDRYGFVPRLFRAQTLAPEALAAEVRVVERLLFGATALSREQKLRVLLAAAAAGRDTYGATLHGKALQMSGVAAEMVERIADDPATAGLPEGEGALLEAARRAGVCAGELDPPDLASLAARGWSSAQVEEMVALAALAGFLHAVQRGLGVPPDFRPKRDFVTDPPAALKLSGRTARPTGDDDRASARTDDPDAPLVDAARAGDMNAFETLVRRHQGRVYRTLLGITGHLEDARDGAQSVFLNVFRKLGAFEGQSLFSTWLHRIAVNEGLERLRTRRPVDRLEETDEEAFRPSSLQAWIEDPESRFARDEMRRIVEEALARLPARYRAALLLRDIQQLSGAEAAAALGIPLPTLKTHLLRGRLMLREALAGFFTAPPSPAGAR